MGRTYCPTHAAEQQRRANTTVRGYGWEHQKVRDEAMRTLIGTPCTRCGEPVLAGQALALDHTDDRTGYLGLAHRHCNNVAGSRKRRGRGTPSRGS